MIEQVGSRLCESGGFHLPLAPEEAFELFTAEGERRWVANWDPVRYGGADQAAGDVFLTGKDAEATIWTVVESDAGAGRLVYARTTPGSRAGIVTVTLARDGAGTRVGVRYELTALSGDGARALAAMEGPAYADMMESWREAIVAAIAASEGTDA